MRSNRRLAGSDPATDRILAVAIFRLLMAFMVVFLSHPVLGWAQSTTESVVERIRQATGYETKLQWKEGLYIEGTGEYLGLPSTFRLYFSPDGRYRSETASQLTIIEGFDGQRGWMVDETGMPGHLELTALEQSQLMAWTTGGYWLSPECPLLVELAPRSQEDPAIVLSLAFPDGILAATMSIDPQSFLPQRCQWTTFGHESFIEFDRYEDVGGFLFPQEMLFSIEFQEIRVAVDTVRPAVESMDHLFLPVVKRPEDTRFHPERGSSVQLIRIPSGNMAVHPEFNGQDVGWFLLDTGAGRSVIDLAMADSLDMAAIGELPAMGFGGMVTVHYRIGQSLTLGPVEIDRPTFLEIDLSTLKGAFGIDISGILGYDLFMRCLVELDVVGDSLFLYEPGAWNALEADWQNFIFHRNAPLLSCSFEGNHTALFDLDTGFPGMVTFNRAFAEQHGLLDERELETFTAGGVGGMVEMLAGQLEWLEIGGHRWEKVPMSVAGASQGVLADEAIAGLVGTGLLPSFRVLIDYPNKRIALVEKE